MPHFEAGKQRLDLMMDQVERAAHHHRPMFLIAVYRSEFTRADVARALQKRLEAQAYRVILLEVTGTDDADLAARLVQHPAAGDPQAVFFCRGLGWGFPATLRSLNLRRELLVERKLKVVFWVTEQEATRLTREAPDFWAFRGRVVEFLESPPLAERVHAASEMAWAGFEDAELRRLNSNARRARLALREKLLAELPEDETSRAARANLHYTLGGLYYYDKRLAQAEQHFQTALELARWENNTRLQAWVLNGLGNVYGDLGRHDEALAAYRQALELDPKYAAPWYGLGLVYRALGRHDEALAAHRKALELNPQLAAPWNGLGVVYRALGRNDEALAAYRKALELDPKLAVPWNGLGNVYYQQGRHDEAVAAYRKAIELDPKLASPWNGLGNVYSDLGRNEEASAACRKALELDPKYAAPWNGLGNVYGDLGRHDEAIEAYRKAVELDPQDAAPHTALGALYELEGRLEEALREHRRAVELQPNDATCHASLASVLRKLGHEAESAEHLTRAREFMANESAYNKACFEAIAGNADVALVHLKRALEQAPGLRLWASRDPDLAFLHDDPRFWELVGGV